MTWTRLFNSRRLIVSLTWTKLFNFRRLIVSLTWKNYFLEIEFSTSKQTILQVQAFQNPLFFVCITSQPNEHIKESYVNITPCKTFPRQPWTFNFPPNLKKFLRKCSRKCGKELVRPRLHYYVFTQLYLFAAIYLRWN